MLKAIVYKINPITGRHLQKLFEGTLGYGGEMNYAEWKEVRETYINHYGEKVEFTLNKLTKKEREISYED